MSMMRIGELQPGMILSQPLQDLAGRTLLKEGAELTARYIERIRKWGFEAVAVEGDDDGPRELPPAVGYPAAGRSWEEVKAEIERRFSKSGDDPILNRLKETVLTRVGELVEFHGGS